jgi:hypothetical protein
MHGIAPSVQRLGYGLGDRKIGVSVPGRGRDFSLLYKIQTGSETQSVSYTVGPVGCFLGVKRQGLTLTIHLHLVPKLRMMEIYLHSTICLHGVVLN